MTYDNRLQLETLNVFRFEKKRQMSIVECYRLFLSIGFFKVL